MGLKKLARLSVALAVVALLAACETSEARPERDGAAVVGASAGPEAAAPRFYVYYKKVKNRGA
jgi:hypothetical protein